MKKLGGKDLVSTIELFDMKDVKIDCFYEGTETVISDKLQKGESTLHTFSKLENREDKFAAWGFGLLDKKLSQKQKEEERVVSGMPIRLVYTGMKQAEIKTGAFGKKIKKDVHQCEIWDITEEFEKKELKETTGDLIYR